MAMTIPRRSLAVAGAGLFALGMPVVLLVSDRSAPANPASDSDAPLQAVIPPVVTALYERPLFAAASEQSEAALPSDAPGLVGIVGRLGEDAVALVRSSDGATRTLRIGESVDGWQLASLAIDAAFFIRGAQRVRVPLPAG